jgi:hypothetical protein
MPKKGTIEDFEGRSHQRAADTEARRQKLEQQ